MKAKALRAWLRAARPAFQRRQTALLHLVRRQHKTVRSGGRLGCDELRGWCNVRRLHVCCDKC